MASSCPAGRTVLRQARPEPCLGVPSRSRSAGARQRGQREQGRSSRPARAASRGKRHPCARKLGDALAGWLCQGARQTVRAARRAMFRLRKPWVPPHRMRPWSGRPGAPNASDATASPSAPQHRAREIAVLVLRRRRTGCPPRQTPRRNPRRNPPPRRLTPCLNRAPLNRSCPRPGAGVRMRAGSSPLGLPEQSRTQTSG